MTNLNIYGEVHVAEIVLKADGVIPEVQHAYSSSCMSYSNPQGYLGIVSSITELNLLDTSVKVFVNGTMNEREYITRMLNYAMNENEYAGFTEESVEESKEKHNV